MTYEVVESIKTLGQRIRQEGGWVVVVVPDTKKHNWLGFFQNVFLALRTEGDVFSGRTLRVPNGGMISVTGYNTPVFVPKDVDFSVMFLGLGLLGTPQIKEMHRWSKAAKNIIKTPPNP